MKYGIKIKTGTKVSRKAPDGAIIDGAGTNADIFVTLFGTKGSSAEIKLPDKLLVNEFEHGKEDDYTINLNGDIGRVVQIKVRSDGRGPSPDWHLESVKVGNDPFPVDRILSPVQGLSIFATEFGPSNQFVNLLNDVQDSYVVTIKTGGGTRLNANTRISLKLWGENGNSVTAEQSENADLNEEQRGWIDLTVTESIRDGITQIRVPGNFGKINACAIRVGENIGSNTWFIESLRFKQGAGLEVSHFPVFRKLSEKDGRQLYLNPGGPEPRPTDLDLNPTFNNTDPEKIFRWIVRNTAEKVVLNKFLNDQKIAGISWGKAYIDHTTDTETLRNRLTNTEIRFVGNEIVMWDSLKKRLDDWLDYRSFAFDYLEDRMKVYLDDLRERTKDELNALKDVFQLGNLPKPDGSDADQANSVDLSGIFSTISTVTSLGALVPDPRVKAAFTLISKTFSLLSSLAAEDPADKLEAAKKKRLENEVEFRTAIEFDKNVLSLTTAGITLNYYVIFQKLEASRRTIRNLVLQSIGILESFASAEAFLKEEFANADLEAKEEFNHGLPERFAPKSAHLKPMLRFAYDQFLQLKCYLRASEIDTGFKNRFSSSNWPMSDFIREVHNRVSSDTMLITRSFCDQSKRLVDLDHWICHQWRLLIEPKTDGTAPKELPDNFLARVKFVYPDSREIYNLLKEKTWKWPSHFYINRFSDEQRRGVEIELGNRGSSQGLILNTKSSFPSGTIVGYLPANRGLNLGVAKTRQTATDGSVQGLLSVPLQDKPFLNISPFSGAERATILLADFFSVEFTWQFAWAQSSAYRFWTSTFPAGATVPDISETQTLPWS